MNKLTLRRVILEITGRLPLAHGLILLMLLAERASSESYPPFRPYTIYTHVGLLFLCTVCMGFKMQRQVFSALHCVHLLFLAYSFQTNNQLKYRDWVRIRLWYRFVGIAGVSLLFAHFTKKQQPADSQFKRLGEILVGIYLVCVAYIVVESPEDRQAFLKFVPGGTAALYIYVLLVATAALCYLPGYFVHDVTQVLIIIAPLISVLVDCQVTYWTKTRGIHRWYQLWLIACNMNMFLGFIMYLSCTEKFLHGELDTTIEEEAEKKKPNRTAKTNESGQGDSKKDK